MSITSHEFKPLRKSQSLPHITTSRHDSAATNLTAASGTAPGGSCSILDQIECNPLCNNHHHDHRYTHSSQQYRQQASSQPYSHHNHHHHAHHLHQHHQLHLHHQHNHHLHNNHHPHEQYEKANCVGVLYKNKKQFFFFFNVCRFPFHLFSYSGVGFDLLPHPINCIENFVGAVGCGRLNY